MEIVRFEEARTYTAPDHDDVVARRLQGAEASTADFVVIGHSTFPDGAAIPMDASPTGKIYVVTEGTITVEQQDGTCHVLQRRDSIFVPAGEARAVRNQSGAAAAMIVVTPAAATQARAAIARSGSR